MYCNALFPQRRFATAFAANNRHLVAALLGLFDQRQSVGLQKASFVDHKEYGQRRAARSVA